MRTASLLLAAVVLLLAAPAAGARTPIRVGVSDQQPSMFGQDASQPTYRSPTRAADFFREMYRLVKGRCRSCAVVALDVLDQAGVDRYMRSFFRHLSSTYRRRATVVGIHNYGDVNRRRTTYTRL